MTNTDEHTQDKPRAKRPREQRPQEFYDQIKERFAAERDARLSYRPPGTEQYIEMAGEFADYEKDPYADQSVERESITDTVEVLLIGGGFSALLTSARLREVGVESIRIVERGADVGGTWYWNRYPGIACDVVSYDYLPLLDEMGYVPSRHYAGGSEILEHCKAIARKYDLYDLAVFKTTVTSTIWDGEEEMWNIETDRGDSIKAKFVICANGTLAKPKLAKIAGMGTFAGKSFHTSRWDYEYTGEDLSNLADKRVAIIGTGASAVQIIPNLGTSAKEVYVFQRTPSSIDVRDDWETDQEWAKSVKPGWQARRRARFLKSMGGGGFVYGGARPEGLCREEKIRAQENANIDAMMRIHRRIDEVVEDPETAESLKPWYMLMCKRPCFHNDYLPTFNLPNVHLIDTKGEGVTQINEKGPVFHEKTYEVDLIIYATGFEVQQTGIYNKIVGEHDVDLNEKYDEGIRTLFGIHSHGFPNLFVMGGYQAPFQFNLTDMLQTQGEHIAGCIDYVRTHGYQSMDPTPEMEQWWVDQVIEHRGKTSRNQDCTPGYYNFEGESNRRQDGNYNGGMVAYIEHMAKVREEKMTEAFDFTTQ